MANQDKFAGVIITVRQVVLNDYGKDENGARWMFPCVYDYEMRDERPTRMSAPSREEFTNKLKWMYPGASIKYVEG